MKVRNISVDGKRIASEENNPSVEKEVIDAIDNNEMYVCRCEEITKAEVIEAVRAGATSVNEVKDCSVLVWDYVRDEIAPRQLKELSLQSLG